MKLSKVYSNLNDLFSPVEFNDGLNVIVAEIKLPKNQNKDVHNIGKTTLGRVIDFGLLLGRSPSFFLFKHEDIFENFIFYLEIKLDDNKYITIKRGVSNSSKISFISHDQKYQNFTNLGQESWDHSLVPIARAKELLDGVLNLRSIGDWEYRKGVGNLLRTQDDYGDVFKLQKYQSSKHSVWKPYIANVLGFDDELITLQYKKEAELSDLELKRKDLEKEIGSEINRLSTIEGMLQIKKNEAKTKQELLDVFDFRTSDFEKIKDLVSDTDSMISRINNERYYLKLNLKKITDSIEKDKIIFNPNEAKKLFEEVGIIFPDTIVKDYSQLIDFNKVITNERIEYLKEERYELEKKLDESSMALNELSVKRSNAMSFIKDADVFEKYKIISNELTELKVDIQRLEAQKELVNSLIDLKKKIKANKETLNQIIDDINENIKQVNSDENSLFAQIRLNFNEVINKVISKNGLLSVDTNKENHIEFKAELVDELGKPTSAGDGYSYKKLMCIAYDLAILKAHSEKSFPKFVFHDGIFESLDDRKKLNMLSVIREYISSGIQAIITLIDSDFPVSTKEKELFNDKEIVLRLNDLGETGRLFKVQSF